VKKRIGIVRFLREFLCFGPEVIVDFIFEQGLLHVSVKNIGKRPAYKVSVQFDKPFAGVGGRKQISELPMFKCVEFLPPQKEIRTFIDTSSSYFGRKEPMFISTTIRYQNSIGQKYSDMTDHSLEIYRDVGYIKENDGP
jgi:hypothetical protein